MEKDILKPVLQEILQEQQQSNEVRRLIIDRLEKVENLVGGFERKLMQIRLNVPPVSTVSIEQLVDGGIQKIRFVVHSHLDEIRKLQEKKKFEDKLQGYIPWVLVGVLLVIICLMVIKGHSYSRGF